MRRMQAASTTLMLIDAAFAVGEGETVLVLLVAPSYAAGRDFS